MPTMGYAVAVPCRSRKAQARMLDFLSGNLRPYHVFMDIPERFSGMRGPLTEEGLIYDRGRCRIGFEYGAGGMDREYGFTVMRWVARKIGRRRSFQGIPEAVPYYVYDGYQAVPVLLWRQKLVDHDRWSWARVKKDCTTTDYWIYRHGAPHLYDKLRQERILIGEEILRLDEMWVDETLQGR